jgi:hypothetical protein
MSADPPYRRIQAVRQHNGSARLSPILRFQEEAAKRRRYAKHRKEVPRALRVANLFRQLPSVAGEIDAVSAIDRHLLYAWRLLLPRGIHPGSDIVERAVATRALFIKLNQPVRIFERQRLEQHRPHDSEQSSVGSDAQRHDQHGNNRESRRSGQGEGGITEVTPDILDHRQRVLPPYLFAHAPGRSELQMCLESRVLPVHAARDVFVDLLRKMLFNLPCNFRIAARPPEKSLHVHAETSLRLAQH